MMEFVLHPDSTMGIYVEYDELFGRREWAFPLTEDERSEHYRQWKDSQ